MAVRRWVAAPYHRFVLGESSFLFAVDTLRVMRDDGWAGELMRRAETDGGIQAVASRPPGTETSDGGRHRPGPSDSSGFGSINCGSIDLVSSPSDPGPFHPVSSDWWPPNATPPEASGAAQGVGSADHGLASLDPVRHAGHDRDAVARSFDALVAAGFLIEAEREPVPLPVEPGQSVTVMVNVAQR